MITLLPLYDHAMHLRLSKQLHVFFHLKEFPTVKERHGTMNNVLIKKPSNHLWLDFTRRL